MTMNCPITNPMDLKRLSAPALLCCAELLASTPARAAGEWVPLSQFQLWPNTPGDTAVRVIPIAAPIVNPAGCADPDSYFVPTTIAKEVQQRIFATLMTAKAVGKPVKVWIDNCDRNRPALNAVQIE
jgi:hypothetical protein